MLPATPSKGLAVVACMDARFSVYEVLGLSEGEAHVIRNGGGVVTDDVIRSLAVSQHKLGTTEIVLIHHTDCGMTKTTDEAFAAELEAAAGEAPGWTLGAFSDPADSVRESIRRLEASPFVPYTDAIRGYVYDVAAGDLVPVDLGAAGGSVVPPRSPENE